MMDEIWVKMAFKSKPIIFAEEEAREQICQTKISKYDQNKTWVWSDAEHIYCGYPYATGSLGFGGRRITFKTIEGEVILYGPWHTSAEDLYQETGVDLRNQYMTRGMCAHRREYSIQDGYIYYNVFHYEEESFMGSYNRIRDIAHEVAHMAKRMVFFYMESNGGTIHGIEGAEYEKNN